MFELVRAGFATRRKMLRRALDSNVRSQARRPRRIGVPARGHRSERAGRDAHAARNGPRSRTRKRRVARPECRFDAFAKLTLSLHVTGTRADGYHELDVLVVSVSEPHDELVIRPATATTIDGHGAERRPACRPTTRTSRCAPRRARRQRRHRAAQGHSARARARRRFGRRGRSAAVGAPRVGRRSMSHFLESSASRPRSAPTCRSACAAAARCACAGSATISSAVKLPTSRS